MVPVMASLKVCESRYSPNKCFIYSNTVFVEFSSFFAGFNGTTPPFILHVSILSKHKPRPPSSHCEVE